MVSPFPVYSEIANMLNDQPELAWEIDTDQLKTVIQLSSGAPSVLLDPHALGQVTEIYRSRTKPPASNSDPVPKQKLKPKLRIKMIQKTPPVLAPVPPASSAPVPPAPPAPAPPVPVPESPLTKSSVVKIKAVFKKRPSLVQQLNQDHTKAVDMSMEELEKIIKAADQAYYLGSEADDDAILNDKVYDYVKDLYNRRRLKTNDRNLTMQSISSSTGVGAVDSKPKKERDAILPVPLRSLDNLFKGSGDVQRWSGSQSGPYFISAKMDGTSALYHQGHLYTRGDATTGRDISHVLKYVKLPAIPDHLAVRGEIVMSKETFDNKYKGKKGSTAIRKVNRNSVSGSLGTVNHIDPAFLSDLNFAAYEVINMREPIQMAPSRGFAALIDMGFQVAWHQQFEEVKITDEQLSTIYTDLLSSYQYEIDGLVIQTDRAYTRQSKKNPDYAKAFKEAFDNDTAITVVTNVEWNISQDGYIKPTVVFNPVKIGNINISRASAHNARMVVEMGIGIGAKIEVIYWAKVNPRINLVLEPVEPSMPSIPYVWVTSGKSGEKPADIKVADAQDDSVSRTIQVKRIHKFLVEIGAKGIGETTVEKIYDLGHKTVGDFINITDDDVEFLGPTASKKLVKSINDAMRSITFPKLMAGSKVFGRGLGTTRFTQLLKAYPDGELVTDRKSRQEYINMFLKVNGFAQKTAELAADGMEEFWKFVDNEIPGSLYEKILDNTIGMVEEPKVSGAGAALKGKKICITGFRDRTISDFIEGNGGTVQGTCNGSTNMVVRPDESYTNKKTEFAEEHNIRIITKEDFMSEYLET